MIFSNAYGGSTKYLHADLWESVFGMAGVSSEFQNIISARKKEMELCICTEKNSFNNVRLT